MNYAQISLINSHVGMRLEWNQSQASDFSYYEVYMSKDNNQTYESIATTENNYYLTGPLQQGRVYYFKIYAWDFNFNRSKMGEEITLRIPRI